MRLSSTFADKAGNRIGVDLTVLETKLIITIIIINTINHHQSTPSSSSDDFNLPYREAPPGTTGCSEPPAVPCDDYDHDHDGGDGGENCDGDDGGDGNGGDVGDGGHLVIPHCPSQKLSPSQHLKVSTTLIIMNKEVKMNSISV